MHQHNQTQNCYPSLIVPNLFDTYARANKNVLSSSFISIITNYDFSLSLLEFSKRFPLVATEGIKSNEFVKQIFHIPGVLRSSTMSSRYDLMF